MTTAQHRRPRLVALVAAGGTVGTAARYLLATAVDAGDGWPTATLLANVLGSFLLGALLEALLRRGAESRRGRLVRLGMGTGVLGGFTTFSSLAIEVERFLADGAVGIAVAYAGVSLALGFAACLAGVVLAGTHHTRRHDRAATDGGGR